MFTFPQPPSSDIESIEGTPVVDLSDEPTELEVFLKATFDADFFLPSPAMAGFNQVIAVLRLSHKYDVLFLRHRAVEHLASLCPVTLQRYERIGSWDGSSVGFTPAQNNHSGPLHLASIQVATEVGALWLLPMAYYRLCSEYELKSVLSFGRAWEELAELQKTAYILGRSLAALVERYPRFIAAFNLNISTSQNGCADPARCNSARLVNLAAHGLLDIPNRPLDDDENDNYWVDVKEDLCPTCYETTKKNHTLAKEDMWNELPQMFVPDWGSLHDLYKDQVGPLYCIISTKDSVTRYGCL